MNLDDCVYYHEWIRSSKLRGLILNSYIIDRSTI